MFIPGAFLALVPRLPIVALADSQLSQGQSAQEPLRGPKRPGTKGQRLFAEMVNSHHPRSRWAHQGTEGSGAGRPRWLLP